MMVSERFTYSFSEPINPEQLQTLFQQTDWAKTRSPLDIQHMLDNSQLILGVWDDDQLVGFARVVTDDIYRAWIEDIVVDEKHRHSGIGTHIVKKLLKRLEHIENVTIDCIPELETFYGKHGFKTKSVISMQVSHQPS